MLTDVDAETGRHRAELQALIEAGKVSPIFGGPSLRDNVFDAWLEAQDRPNPAHAFTVACRRWYAAMQRKTPALVAMRERLAASRRAAEQERQSAIEDAAAYLEAHSTRPLQSEIDEAERRGELSREAAVLARHGWDLHQRCAEAQGGGTARVQRLMEKLEAAIGGMPADTMHAVRRVLVDELGRQAA